MTTEDLTTSTKARIDGKSDNNYSLHITQMYKNMISCNMVHELR